ncbi:hypothetical protein AAGG52_04945 [Bacillus licheniformis]
MFASFIVYLSVVYHYTIGGINIPPQSAYAQMNIQLIPFYFGAEWVQMYQQSGFDWFFGIPSSLHFLMFYCSFL